MDSNDARRALAELAVARDLHLVTESQAMKRTAAILDRTDLRPVNLIEFLRTKGHSNSDLFRVVGPFGVAVKAAYKAKHGHDPLHRLQDAGGSARPVYAYVDDDLDLIEATYSTFSHALTLTN